jgi:hypothetical protein
LLSGHNNGDLTAKPALILAVLRCKEQLTASAHVGLLSGTRRKIFSALNPLFLFILLPCHYGNFGVRRKFSHRAALLSIGQAKR